MGKVRVGGRSTLTLMETCCFEKPNGLQGAQRKGCAAESLQISVNLKQDCFLPLQATQAALKHWVLSSPRFSLCHLLTSELAHLTLSDANTWPIPSCMVFRVQICCQRKLPDTVRGWPIESLLQINSHMQSLSLQRWQLHIPTPGKFL